ncbi:MAG TPA: LEA type 2 family protein [Myxococcus sp.]|nr:LEA type 2 family protein [Myxococcus sp.]
MRLLSLTCVLVILGAVTSGCVSKPKVALRTVELTRVGRGGGSLLVTLEVTNPNSFALHSEGMQYALELQNIEGGSEGKWTELVTGSYDAPFSIGPEQSATLEVPVDFDYSRLGGAAVAMLFAGKLDYRARGTVMVRTPVGTHALPFKKQGTLGRK